MTQKQLTVTELVERDNLKFEGRNNMILSPVGSGKTHFMKEVIAPQFKGLKLLLVSSTALKESTYKEGDFYSTKDLRRKELQIKEENIHIMTYAEFGREIEFDFANKFLNGYELILCDEIHSLFDYYMSHKTAEYSAAIKYLFSQYKKIKTFYFTATTEMIKLFMKTKRVNPLEGVDIYNYLKDSEVKSNKNKEELVFYESSELHESIERIVEERRENEKGLIFSRTKKGMKKIEEAVEDLGSTVISIWSINNKEKMNDEQLRVRKMFLEEGRFPDEYDFVNINGAMREGWNLNDKRVQVMLIDDVSETNKIQPRGRIRHDVRLVISKEKATDENLEQRIIRKEMKEKLFESVLGKEVTSEEVKEICLKLNVKNGQRIAMFNLVKTVLENNGYTVESYRKIVKGKKQTFYKINKKEVEVKAEVQEIEQTQNKVEIIKASVVEVPQPIQVKEVEKQEVEKPEVKAPVSILDYKASKKANPAKAFLGKLGDEGLFDKNKAFFDNYMGGKGKSVAINQIIRMYDELVVEKGMSEKDFKSITALIIHSREIFTEKFYAEEGQELRRSSEDRVNKIVLKVLDDKELAKAVEAKHKETENELLDYMRSQLCV